MTGVATERIESPKNPRIKALVRLHARREREREGRTLVEGTRETSRALQAGVAIEAVYVAPAMLSPEGFELRRALASAGVTTVEVTNEAFDRVSRRQGPDGVVAVIRPPERTLSMLDLPADPLLLIAVDTEKPGNLGALIRSADAAGADALLCVGGAGTDPWNPGVIRASMGSVFTLPVVAVDEAAARSWLRARDVPIVATSPTAEVDVWDADLKGPVAIVVGPEHEGLDGGWTDDAANRVRVPMRGAADSLNVSVTGALLLFEALRQRRAARPTD